MAQKRDLNIESKFYVLDKKTKYFPSALNTIINDLSSKGLVPSTEFPEQYKPR